MSARDILHRVEELINAEIADRVRNARAEAIRGCAEHVHIAAEAFAPLGKNVSAVDAHISKVLFDLAKDLESMR